MTAIKAKLNQRETRVMAMFDDVQRSQNGTIWTAGHTDNMAVRSLEKKGLIEVLQCESYRARSFGNFGWDGSHYIEVKIESRKV